MAKVALFKHWGIDFVIGILVGIWFLSYLPPKHMTKEVVEVVSVSESQIQLKVLNSNKLVFCEEIPVVGLDQACPVAGVKSFVGKRGVAQISYAKNKFYSLDIDGVSLLGWSDFWVYWALGLMPFFGIALLRTKYQRFASK